MEFLKKLFKKNKKSNSEEMLSEMIERIEEASAESDAALETRIIKNVIHIDKTYVSDVMTPRSDIIVIEADETIEDLVKLCVKERHTRFPVFEGNLDNVIGFVHVKDIIAKLDKPNDTKVREIMRNILTVSPSMKVVDLLVQMRAERTHIAIVIDEYGGTDGLVTIEDLVEEIIGEIEDEYDHEEHNYFREISSNLYEVSGRMLIEDLEKKLNIVINPEDDDLETIGGYVTKTFGHIPADGEKFMLNDEYELEVVDADPRKVKKINLHRRSI